MSLEKFIKWISGLVALSLFSFIVYFSFQVFVWDEVYEETSVKPITITVINADTGIEHQIIYEKQQLSESKPFVMLLLGADSKNISYGRADTIILATVEPKKKKISLLSVPRDTYMTNAKTKKLDKINHTFNYGISNTISTLEDFFNIPIDYYASVNMKGFVEVVDTIGGLTINVEKNLSFHDRLTNTDFSLRAGQQSLNGTEALNYARYRSDGEGDFGRNRRQRQVINELIRQSTEFQNISNLKQLLSILGQNFRTNIKPLEMGVLIKQIGFGASYTIEEMEMKAKPAWRNQLSVVLVDEVEKKRITQIIHDKLNISTNE